MNSLLTASREQTGKLDELINIMSRRSRDGGSSSGAAAFVQPKFEIPAFYKIAIGAIAGLMLLSVGISTVSLISTTSSKNNSAIEITPVPALKTQPAEDVPDSLRTTTMVNGSEETQSTTPSESKTN
jgi:hypothetical protein